MDAKAEIIKVWKDVQASAKEFVSLGLTSSAKALGTTGARLKTFEEKLKGTAEKWKPAPAPEAPKAETEAPKQ